MNEMITAEDAVETSIYLANAPECCSGEEKLKQMLGLLGAGMEEDDLFHDEDQHLAMM